MLYEMTTQDVKMEFNPFQDVFVSSSREEISKSEILERWFSSFRGKLFEKPLSVISNLSPTLQIDYSSSIYQLLEFKSETTFTDRKVGQLKVLEKISKIYDELIQKEEIFREINKTKLIKTISEIMSEIPFEQFNISEEELSKRVKGVLIIEALSGILNELTPKQIKEFNKAVNRKRTLFK